MEALRWECGEDVRRSEGDKRKRDFAEITVSKDDKVIFRGAYVYGFRSIQNLIMKIKVVLWGA